MFHNPQEFLSPDDDKLKRHTDDKITKMISEAQLPALRLWTFAILKHHPSVADTFIEEVRKEFANPANGVDKAEAAKYWSLVEQQVKQTSKEYAPEVYKKILAEMKSCSMREEKQQRPRSQSMP